MIFLILVSIARSVDASISLRSELSKLGGLFENGALLMITPEGVSSVANFIIAYEESQ